MDIHEGMRQGGGGGKVDSPSEDEENIKQRLEQIIPDILKIQEIFSIPSISIGVLHHGKVVFTKNFGYADHSTKRNPDSETIYCIASCTKAFTGTALHLLAAEGLINVDEPVSKYIPEFRTVNNPIVGEKATIKDLLSHSTGLASLLYTMLGRNQSMFARVGDVVDICSKLPCAAPFRSEWSYNNWMYALAGQLVKVVSGQSCGESIKTRILDELGMTRSNVKQPDDDNFARPYKIYSNGSMEEKEPPALAAGDAFDASGCVRTCVRDMLIWCRTMIAATRLSKEDLDKYEPIDGTDGRRKRLLKAIAGMQRPQFTLAKDEHQNYGGGIYNFLTPTTEMNTISNWDLIDEPWVLGKDSSPMRVIGHNGELGGYLTTYLTFPETESAVVVLTTGTAATHGDPSNLLAQPLTQALFGLQPKIDYLTIAKNITRNAKARWDKTDAAWRENRHPGPPSHLMEWYTGMYRNSDLHMTLEVSLNSSERKSEFPLQLCVNGVEEQTFHLRHYHENTWSFFPMGRDESVREGLDIYIYDWRVFNLHFESSEEGEVCSGVIWSLGLDPRVGPTRFNRE